MEKLQEPADRVREALEALRTATSFRAAKRHWSDYLIYWRRALNRICGEGVRRDRNAWIKIDRLVKADPALNYLWEARNEDEHGLTEIATMQPEGIQIGANGFNGFIKSVSIGPSGWEVAYTSDQPVTKPIVQFHPEGLKLESVSSRAGEVPVPVAYDYAAGTPSAPVALAEYGLRFVESKIIDALSLQVQKR